MICYAYIKMVIDCLWTKDWFSLKSISRKKIALKSKVRILHEIVTETETLFYNSCEAE